MNPIADNMNTSPVNVTFSAAPMQESGVKMPAFDHYLVYRDGEMIKNTKSKSFTDTNRPNGKYLYEVTAVYVNECESDPISVEVEVSENGIGDDFNSDIKVYPNPANNVLTVNGIEMTSIVIYNSLGQTVATIPVNGNTVNIETSSYPAGMYFIDVNTADNVVVRTKVVIAR